MDSKEEIEYYALQFQEVRIEGIVENGKQKLTGYHKTTDGTTILPIGIVADGEWSQLFNDEVRVLTLPPNEGETEPHHIFMLKESMKWITSENIEEYDEKGYVE